MISASNLLSLALLYVCVLFAVAWYADRRSEPEPPHRSKRLKGIFYALTLAVYCSSWTFYGAVGSATEAAWSHAAIYLGPMLMFLLGWPLINRLLAVGARHRVTSIADLIGARFGKRQSLAVIVTLVATAAVLPYIALQFKALAQAWAIVGGSTEEVESIGGDTALLTAILLAVFTILFGTRRLDGRERHQGVMTAIAVESLVKLVAFSAVAILAAIYLYQLPYDDFAVTRSRALREFSFSMEFFTQILISALAIICLPRQFHVMVVEAQEDTDTRIARWLFPAYLGLFMLLVVPISLAGAHFYSDVEGINPDTYVQLLPISLDNKWVTVAAFIGGISAATGMVIVATLSLAIMITNEVVTPLLLSLNSNAPGAILKLGDNLRRVRQVTIAFILLAAWLVARQIVAIPWLAQIGFISFLAAAQLAPAIVAGMYWRRAHGGAVTLGLVMGVGLWFYCGVLPALLPEQSPLMQHGLFNILWLRPEHLLGLTSEHPLAYATGWSLGVNSLLLVGLSLIFGPSAADFRQAQIFINLTQNNLLPPNTDFDLSLIRVSQLQVLLQPFVSEHQLRRMWLELETANQQRLLPGDRAPNFMVNRVESVLASNIGATSAHKAIDQLEHSQQLEFTDLAGMLSDASKLHTFNRELLQTTVENLAQGVSVVDKELRLVAWNSRYEELFGYPERFLYVGCPIERVYRFNAERGILSSGADSITADIERRLQWIREGHPHRLERTLPDGKVIDIRGNPLPHRGFVTTYMDITDYRDVVVQLEEAKIELEAKVASGSENLSEINARLRQENRLRAQVETRLREAHRSKSRFMSATSHDLLQPINAARLFNSALATRLESDCDPDIRKIVTHIDSSLRRAEQLIAELREIARLDSGHQTPRLSHFSVNQLFDGIQQEFQALAQNNNLQLRVKQSSLWLYSDQTMIHRVMQNLVSNALLYTSSGGILLAARRAGEHIKLQVWDTGPGIAEQDQVKIFQEFERGPRQRDNTDKGLGLGLSIVQRITNLLELPLELKSKVGHGTCFSIFIPPGEPQTPAAVLPQQDGDLSGLTLLCLDNDPMILNGLEQLLTSLGAKVQTASNRHEVHNLLRHQPAVDVILADYQLDAGANGIDVIKEIMAEFALDIPCIVISADDAPKTRELAREAGFRFLPKPVNEARLRAFIIALTGPK